MKNANITVNSVLVIFRPDSEDAQKLAQDLSQWLSKKNLTCYSHPQQQISGATSIDNIDKADLVVVLGGDGTYLEAVRLLEGRQTPILGVNLGSLGFLTENRAENLYKVLEQALRSELELRKRSMLQVTAKTLDGEFTYKALNDIVIERGEQSQLLNVAISIESQLISHLKADGLIFSTPTGSTAYNLAAGGPILHPELSGYAMTPVCAHSLTNRPTIFPDNFSITVKLNNSKHVAVLTVDGQKRLKITGTDTLLIKKADCNHSVLRQPSHNYFDLLREKLSFGVRA